MKALNFIPVFLLLCGSLAGQSYNLDSLTKQAVENFSLSHSVEKLQRADELQQEALGKNYLPRLTFSAQATYQSDVTEVPIDNPLIDVPTISKDQYKATLEIQQSIYDGGITAKQKQLQSAKTAIDQQSIKVEQQKIKDKVAEVYFNLLSVEKNLEVISLSQEELEKRENSMQAAVDNGVMLPSELKLLQAERIKLRQRRNEAESAKKTLTASLSILCGTELSAKANFKVPEVKTGFEKNFSSRPDYVVLEQNKNLLRQQIELKESATNPKLFAFGTAGYGRPGLNMLENDFAAYYIVGAKFTWPVWDWNATKLENQSLAVQQEVLTDRQDALTQQLSTEQTRLEENIRLTEQQLQEDEELLKLRSEIKAQYAAQLDNGTTTSTDYLHHFNQEKIALIQKETRTIQLIEYQYKLKILFNQ